MPKTSSPSNPVYSINFPYGFLENFNSKFFYNFYTTDESTQADSKIPDVYKKPTINKDDVNLKTYSLRIPRYVELNWQRTTYQNFSVGENKKKQFLNVDLEKNFSKIITENNTINSKHTPYRFSSYNIIENAAEDINKTVSGELLTESGISQAYIIEKFVSSLIEGYEENPEKPNLKNLRSQIETSIESIEKIADRQEEVTGIKFFDENGKIKNEFDKVVENDPLLYSQINNVIITDIFTSSSLPNDNLSNFNKISANSDTSIVADLAINPVEIGETVSLNALDNSFIDSTNTVQVVGYIIEKFKFENESYVKDKVFFINNPDTTSILDSSVKYNGVYYYSIRAIAQLKLPSLLADGSVSICTYYFAGKNYTTQVICKEEIPPPAPIEIDFTWDYKHNNFYVTWQMPFNSQRDITQFQVFRRRSIYEPFELLEQQSFDLSEIKKTTGEAIDGNKQDMTQEEQTYVTYTKFPSLIYQDSEFKLNYETREASKYIYTIASIDAHGLISNYGVQYEITFDFFKNQLVKKLISPSGAPRAYPNLLLNADLFKDIIQVSGISSQKLKIYFMPEYFKLRYNSGKIEKLIATQQDSGEGGYYKLQFINVQNQKTDQLKIKINDPNLLASVPLQQ